MFKRSLIITAVLVFGFLLGACSSDDTKIRTLGELPSGTTAPLQEGGAVAPVPGTDKPGPEAGKPNVTKLEWVVADGDVVGVVSLDLTQAPPSAISLPYSTTAKLSFKVTAEGSAPLIYTLSDSVAGQLSMNATGFLGTGSLVLSPGATLKLSITVSDLQQSKWSRDIVVSVGQETVQARPVIELPRPPVAGVGVTSEIPRPAVEIEQPLGPGNVIGVPPTTGPAGSGTSGDGGGSTEVMAAPTYTAEVHVINDAVLPFQRLGNTETRSTPTGITLTNQNFQTVSNSVTNGIACDMKCPENNAVAGFEASWDPETKFESATSWSEYDVIGHLILKCVALTRSGVFLDPTISVGECGSASRWDDHPIQLFEIDTSEGTGQQLAMVTGLVASNYYNLNRFGLLGRIWDPQTGLLVNTSQPSDVAGDANASSNVANSQYNQTCNSTNSEVMTGVRVQINDGNLIGIGGIYCSTITPSY